MIFSAYKIIIPLNWNLTQNFCIHNIMSNTYLSLWTASKSKDDLKKCGWPLNNEQDGTLLLVKLPLSSIFRQHAVSIYGFVRYVMYVCVSNKILGRRLRFGMMTVLTNIRSTKVLYHASCIMHCSSNAEIRYADCSHK